MRVRSDYLLLFPAFVAVMLFLLYYLQATRSLSAQEGGAALPSGVHYYEHQKAYLKYTGYSQQYHLAVVADKDKDSKVDSEWQSLLKYGTLLRSPQHGNYSVQWTAETVLASTLAEDGRAMELSELVWFNGRLLAPDDRTGVVFSIENDKAVPVHILMDGNGRSNKGFKSEWASVKDGLLYIGSVGKEWSAADGVLIHNNPQWVKTIDSAGTITHIDWREQYSKMRKEAGAEHPGYLMHEAAAWNPVLKKWFFLPRRHSIEAYNDVLDESKGTNIIISADENFENIQVGRVGTLHPTRGFSSVVFLPGREKELLCLKSEEHKGTIATYMVVLNVESGEVLMEEEHIGHIKFEGVEII